MIENVQIEYSKHIENRLRIRKIDRDLPKQIFEEAEERYFDEETGHLIAVKEVNLYDKNREVMVAYIIDETHAILLTIHPLKVDQKEKRIHAKRWRKI